MALVPVAARGAPVGCAASTSRHKPGSGRCGEEKARKRRIGGTHDERDLVGYMTDLGLPHPQQMDAAVPPICAAAISRTAICQPTPIGRRTSRPSRESGRSRPRDLGSTAEASGSSMFAHRHGSGPLDFG